MSQTKTKGPSASEPEASEPDASEPSASGPSASGPRSGNITFHEGEVQARARRRAHGHAGAAIWLTGLSGSGKSTVARRLERRLIEQGVFATVLDGDNMRHGLCADLGFSAEDRRENIRRVGEVVRLFVDAGAIVITAFISPYRADRERLRAAMAPGSLIEVHINTPLEVCEARDPKGLYRKARAGQIKDFTGLDAPYEAPLHPELTLDTSRLGLEEASSQILAYLHEAGLLGRGDEGEGARGR